jgi:glutathione S-transferase
MSLTLYYHPLASFCHKVLLALYENGTPFEARVIDLSKDSDSTELRNIWPIRKFPVIRDHDRKRDVPESSIIIEYLDHYFPGATRLIPVGADEALDVPQWDRIFDLYVHLPMQKIVGDSMRSKDKAAETGIADIHSTLETSYAMIDRRMASRTRAAGTTFSMADCAAAPALFYTNAVQPFAAEHTNLAAYFDRLAERPSFRRVIDQARPYFPMFPFVSARPGGPTVDRDGSRIEPSARARHSRFLSPNVQANLSLGPKPPHPTRPTRQITFNNESASDVLRIP